MVRSTLPPHTSRSIEAEAAGEKEDVGGGENGGEFNTTVGAEKPAEQSDIKRCARYRRSRRPPGPGDRVRPPLPLSRCGRRLTEIMWLMPMMIGQAIHGNADDPPVPVGPVKAYDLDSKDEQDDKDECAPAAARLYARI